jgi:hypothetical protein
VVGMLRTATARLVEGAGRGRSLGKPGA